MRGNLYSHKMFCDYEDRFNLIQLQKQRDAEEEKINENGESWALLHTMGDTEHCKWTISTITALTWHSHPSSFPMYNIWDTHIIENIFYPSSNFFSKLHNTEQLLKHDLFYSVNSGIKTVMYWFGFYTARSIPTSKINNSNRPEKVVRLRIQATKT